MIRVSAILVATSLATVAQEPDEEIEALITCFADRSIAVNLVWSCDRWHDVAVDAMIENWRDAGVLDDVVANLEEQGATLDDVSLLPVQCRIPGIVLTAPADRQQAIQEALQARHQHVLTEHGLPVDRETEQLTGERACAAIDQASTRSTSLTPHLAEIGLR